MIVVCFFCFLFVAFQVFAKPSIITVSQKKENSLIVYDVKDGGHLVPREGSPFPTGGRGDVLVGGQNSLIKARHFVVGINGGDNSIFVMKEEEDGSFQKVFQQPSTSPLSIVTLSYKNGRIYAGHSSSFVPGRSRKEVISVYKLDEDGKITPEVSNNIFFDNIPAIQVTDIRLNDSGETLAISYTLRPHFIDLIFKFRGNAHIDFYSVDRTTGKLTTSRDSRKSFPKGEGFGVVWNGDSVLYQTITRSRVNSYSLSGDRIERVEIFPAGGNACCWNVLLDRGHQEQYVYTSNFSGAEKLSVFSVGEDPVILERQQGVELPGVSTLDLALSSDGEFLFVLLTDISSIRFILNTISFGIIPRSTRGGILTFKIMEDGSLDKVSDVMNIPRSLGFLFLE